jgi:hypothetical protein
MKNTVLALLIASFGAISTNAQVACSPNVDPSTCKTVASRWNAVLDHVILRGTAISVELLAPSEYGQRVAQIHGEDAALGMRCTGCPPAYVGAPKYQAFDNLWTDDILLLRERGGATRFRERFSFRQTLLPISLRIGMASPSLKILKMSKAKARDW